MQIPAEAAAVKLRSMASSFQIRLPGHVCMLYDEQSARVRRTVRGDSSSSRYEKKGRGFGSTAWCIWTPGAPVRASGRMFAAKCKSRPSRPIAAMPCTHRLPRRFGRPPLSTKQKCPRIPGLVQPDHLDTRATCVISSAHSAEPGATMSTYSAAQRAREELELS